LQTIDAGGSGVSFASVSSAGINVTSDLNVRILVVGNNHKVKWWSGTEPGTWQISANDSTFTEATFAFGLYSGAGTGLVGVQYDNLSLTALTPTTPSTLWKGVGAIREAAMASDLTLVNVSWYYDWASQSVTGIGPVPSTPGIEYVPQMWGDWDRTYAGFDVGGTPGGVDRSIRHPARLQRARRARPGRHDRCSGRWRCGRSWRPPVPGWGHQRQAVASPTTRWGGSPASCRANGGAAPRVDFMCVHWYPEYDSGYSSLAAFLDYIHTTYARPVWLTEIGTLGGGASANAAMVDDVMDICNARPWVERIAWFVLNDTNAGWPNTGLVASGALTAAGTIYATYPERPTNLSIAVTSTAAGGRPPPAPSAWLVG
jgi:hypothetical protein